LDRTRFGSQKRRNSRLKDLHRSYIPEAGLAQHPVAVNSQSWPAENGVFGPTYQVRNHDLGLSTAKGCGGRGRSRLCLLVLPRVLGDTADRRGSRSRAARGGLAAATATARGGGLAGLEDLVQAELHLVGHVAKCGGGDTWGEAGRGASACWYQADGERVAQTARPLVWLMETRQAASGAMKTKGAFDGAERDAGGRVCLCTCLMDRRTSGEGSAVKKLAVAV